MMKRTGFHFKYNEDVISIMQFNNRVILLLLLETALEFYGV